MITHPYKYIHIQLTPTSIFEMLSRLDLEIYKVSHQEHSIVDGDVVFH
jgi:hypothetical protein